VDLWNLIADDIGVEARFVEESLDSVLDGVEVGRLDVGLGALTITPQREQRFDFSHPFYTSGYAIVTPERGGVGIIGLLTGFPIVSFLQALAGLSLVLLAGGVVLWLFERKKNAEQFGKGARGDLEMLSAMGRAHGFDVEEIPPLIVESERVSSTLIRERVLQGDLDTVEALLGRKYSITGEVQRGRGIGAELGYPTANIKPNHSAVPAQGVYIATAIVDGRRLPAAVNIGIAPTIRQEDLTIEAHILDFTAELAGEEIEIEFHKRIRPEKKFRNREELTAQIARDVQSVRDYFASAPP